MKKKIFLMSLLSVSLTACVSEQKEEDNSSTTPIVAPTVQKPSIYQNINPLSEDSKNLSLSFTMNADGGQSYRIFSSSANNPIRNVSFDLKLIDPELANYITNYSLLINKIEDMNQNFMKNKDASISINFDHVPADFLQDKMQTNSRIIKNAITLEITIDNGVIRKESIAIDLNNINELPSIASRFLNAISILENESYAVTIPITDRNLNDNLKYQFTNIPSFIEIQNILNENCIKNLDNENNNFCIANNKQIQFLINAKEIQEEFINESINFSITDLSKAGNNLNVVNYTIPVIVNNKEEDLYPIITLPDSVFNVNESSSYEIIYDYEKAKDREDFNLVVTPEIDLSGLDLTFQHLPNEKKLRFTNININDNYSRVLKLNITDGKYKSTTSAIINFINDVDRSPQLDIISPNPTQISEQNGGFIEYQATLNNPNKSLNVTYQIDTGGKKIKVDHSPSEKRIYFSEIDITENYSTTLKIIATDGIDSIEKQINVEFINDVSYEKLAFQDRYINLKNNYSNIMSRNDEIEIFSFYKEFALINQINPFLINEYETRINNSLQLDKQELVLVYNKIEDFISIQFPTSQQIAQAELDLIDFRTKLENLGLFATTLLNDFRAELGTLPTLNVVKNSLSPNGVFGRYVGLSTYGSYIDQEKTIWRFNNNYKMLELVNPNFQCN